MAEDRKMNEFTTVQDAAYIYAEAADSSQVKISASKFMENGGVYHLYTSIDAGRHIVLPYLSGLIIVQNASASHSKGCAVLNADNTGVVLCEDVNVNYFSEIANKICVLNTGSNTNYIVKNTCGGTRMVGILFIS